MIPTINNTTRVSANTVTPTDRIISNLIIDAGFKTEILRNCILDHFAIMLAFPICEKKVCNKSEQHSHKQMFYEASIQSLRLRLRGVKWHSLKTSNGSN